MIRSIIIEDEKNVREGLKKILKIISPEIDIIAETGYIKNALSLIKELKPDLVFMDIELEDGNSFEILKRLENINFKIIFITAYNQYAIKAFKFSAIDYLLKPIDPLELKNAIQKAIEDIDHEKQYIELLSVIKSNAEKEGQKIILKTADKRFIFLTKDIIRLEANGAYTVFVTKDKKVIISKNIKYYQDILDSSFARCHQSHLVNIKHIVSILKNGEFQLSNNEIIPISTRKKSEMLEILRKK